MTAKISITDHDSGEQIGQTETPQPQPQVIKPTPTPSELESQPAFVHPIPTSEPPLEEMSPNVPSPEVPRFGTLQPKVDAHPLFSGTKEPVPKNRRWLKRTLAPLAGLIVVLIILYLTIDAGLVKGYSHLPFHFFKAPISESAPVITPAKTTTTTPAATDPYAGWKTYTLENEKATFKYPSSWSLTDNTGPNFTAKSDSIALKGPNGFLVSMSTGGLGHPTADGPAFVLHAVPVTFLGQTGYLDYTSLVAASSNSQQSDGLVSLVTVSKSSSQFLDTFPSKAVGENSGTSGNFILQASYIDAQSKTVEKSLNSATSDSNYQDFKLLIQSLTY